MVGEMELYLVWSVREGGNGDSRIRARFFQRSLRRLSHHITIAGYLWAPALGASIMSA